MIMEYFGPMIDMGLAMTAKILQYNIKVEFQSPFMLFTIGNMNVQVKVDILANT